MNSFGRNGNSNSDRRVFTKETSGVVLTRSTPIFDLVNERVIRAENGVLTVPERAVVVSGARAIRSPFGVENGLSLYTPVIVKYRDEKTDATTVLESILHALD